MSTHKGYHIEETPSGFKVYRDREAWIKGEDPLYVAASIEQARDWIDSKGNIWYCLPPGPNSYYRASDECRNAIGRLVGRRGWRETIPVEWMSHSEEIKVDLEARLNSIIAGSRSVNKVRIDFSDPPGWSHIRVIEMFKARRIVIVLPIQRPGDELPITDILMEFCYACGKADVVELARGRELHLPFIIKDQLLITPPEPITVQWLSRTGEGFAVLEYLGLWAGSRWAEKLGSDIAGQYKKFADSIADTKFMMIKGVTLVDRFGERLIERLQGPDHNKLSQKIIDWINEIMGNNMSAGQ